MVHSFFVGFVNMSSFLGFGYGLVRSDLGLQFGIGIKKIKVYLLADGGASPKCIGTMKGEDGESLGDLRVRLEENKI